GETHRGEAHEWAKFSRDLPDDGESSGQQQEHDAGKGVGIDERAADAAFFVFRHDYRVGDVDAVRVNDDVFLFEFQEQAGGHVGPAGLLAFDEHLVFAGKLKQLL